jgi:hypothetical protein
MTHATINPRIEDKFPLVSYHHCRQQVKTVFSGRKVGTVCRFRLPSNGTGVGETEAGRITRLKRCGRARAGTAAAGCRARGARGVRPQVIRGGFPVFWRDWSQFLLVHKKKWFMRKIRKKREPTFRGRGLWRFCGEAL